MKKKKWLTSLHISPNRQQYFLKEIFEKAIKYGDDMQYIQENLVQKRFFQQCEMIYN